MNTMTTPSLRALMTLAVVSAVILIAIEAFPKNSERQKLSPVQIRTYEKVVEAQKILFEKRGLAVTDETASELQTTDPLETGLIGIEWSHLVTTPGSFEAKTLSCNPGWGILVNEWLGRAGVEPGSTVAIGSSGSFPALMVTTRIAVESMGAIPVVIGSMTSSNFGATIPEFDLYSIEQVLLEEGIVDHPMAMLTPGGEQDRLYGFAKNDKELIDHRLNQISSSTSHTEIFQPKNLHESIEKRSRIFFSENTPELFINIGGNSANYGTGAAALALPKGFSEPEDARKVLPPGESVARRALDQGLPVINLIGLRSIALENSGYLNSERELPAWLVRSEWSTIQRIMALIFSGCILVACIMLRQQNQNKTLETGDHNNA